MSQSRLKLETSNIEKMSEFEAEFLTVKCEPADAYPESSSTNAVEGLSDFERPAQPVFVAASAKDKMKPAKRKAKKSNAAGSFVCLLCNKEYVYEAFLTRHMVSKHRACEPIHQYRCRQCGAIFADEAGFEKHKSLFFEFLRHHIERVRPKDLEQENEVLEFEEFVKATIEKGEEEGEMAVNNDGAESGQEGDTETSAANGFVDSMLEDLNGPPAEKRRKEETDPEWKETGSSFLFVN